jgi:hypothetical protein
MGLITLNATLKNPPKLSQFLSNFFPSFDPIGPTTSSLPSEDSREDKWRSKEDSGRVEDLKLQR